MKKGDKLIIIIVAAVALIALGIILITASDANNKAVSITVDQKPYMTMSLNKDTTLTVATQYGSNTIQIKDGSVKVTSADCPDKICVHTKAAHKVGNIIVCLPHRLIITIEKAE
ncbi:MAG: NusG domain II-containing protein [Eubacteriaceae bacterium]|nr:NusG domain II-containing protein [Eubacteriaceae bacterium]